MVQASSYRLFALFALILVSGCTSIERLALPDAVLGDAYWERYDASSQAAIDHAPLQAFLDRYVATDTSGVNRVDYGAVNADDRADLKRYLTDLQVAPIHQYRRAEQLAFWVNLYNAKTVDIVLDHYPVDTIRDIKLGSGLIVVGPWGAPVLQVSGRYLSLNDIEHMIIRPVWQDERIHYVLNCAAAGCPNLSRQAYQGWNIDAAMTAAAEAYVNDPRGVRIDEQGKLRLSKIYGWFREDFGGDQRSVIGAVSRYAAPALKADLAKRQRIDRYGYDWALNDAKSEATPLTARSSPTLDQRPDAQPDVSPDSALSVASTAGSTVR
ncbi:MAG: DUF547 domain-containing protein [Geminicoccales bacterium]